MRDKRTHRNYAPNSLNLTFLLRYTGPAYSEVTNFIGKRAIYRSPRSHTISSPATPRTQPVYTGTRLRLSRAHHSVRCDSVHTDLNSRFVNLCAVRCAARHGHRWRLVSTASIYDIELYPAVEINVADLGFSRAVRRGTARCDDSGYHARLERVVQRPRTFESEILQWRKYGTITKSIVAGVSFLRTINFELTASNEIEQRDNGRTRTIVEIHFKERWPGLTAVYIMNYENSNLNL